MIVRDTVHDRKEPNYGADRSQSDPPDYNPHPMSQPLRHDFAEINLNLFFSASLASESKRTLPPLPPPIWLDSLDLAGQALAVTTGEFSTRSVLPTCQPAPARSDARLSAPGLRAPPTGSLRGVARPKSVVHQRGFSSTHRFPTL
jgi:hypothetical protein